MPGQWKVSQEKNRKSRVGRDSNPIPSDFRGFRSTQNKAVSPEPVLGLTRSTGSGRLEFERLGQTVEHHLLFRIDDAIAEGDGLGHVPGFATFFQGG